jgi:hypothetical protein
MSKRWFFAAAAVGLVCTSCGSSNKLYPVSGTVTYKGSPAAGATVFLQRRGAEPLNEQTIMGIVKEDGSFSLVCGAQCQGVPPGEYDVLIEWKPRSKQAKGLAQKTADRLQGRYADPKNPRWRAVVKAGPNQLGPFELTD